MNRSVLTRHLRSLGNLLQRPSRLQRLAVEAAIDLTFVRVALKFVSFARLKRHLDEQVIVVGGLERPGTVVIDDVVWAVDRVSRRAPEQLMCLPRALAVCRMMGRRGFRGQLEIGVKRDPFGRFLAHAWVEYEGKVVIGDLPDLGSFSRLDSWPVSTRP